MAPRRSRTAVISEIRPRIVRLAGTSPLQRSLSPSTTLWAPVPYAVTPAGSISKSRLPPPLKIADRRFSPVKTPGLKDVIKSLADLKLGPLEGHSKVTGVVLSTARILSHATAAHEQTAFERLTFYPKELLAIVDGVLDLAGACHPALKQGVEAVTFVFKTADCAYALICELKTGKADPNGPLNAVTG